MTLWPGLLESTDATWVRVSPDSPRTLLTTPSPKFLGLPCSSDGSTLVAPRSSSSLSPFGSDPAGCYTPIGCVLAPHWLSADPGLSPVIRASPDSSFLDHLLRSPFKTPPRRFSAADSLSPLTPLTSPPPKKRALFSSPYLRSKRPRPTRIPTPPRQITPTPSPSPSPSPAQRTRFSTRSFPATLKINPAFPLFYRRFPASAFSPDLPSRRSPGGTYNPPRSPLDLYTPRFVKGKGVDKLGLCPICIEPSHRGGAHKKLWLAMKFSAFKSYHMQYAHGISASTGRPFSPPTAFRTLPRPHPAKKEKTHIQHGKCHKCAKWVPIEGVKDMESKVKELHWWKHAAACHQDSTIDGECDLYEDDDVLALINALHN